MEFYKVFSCIFVYHSRSLIIPLAVDLAVAAVHRRCIFPKINLHIFQRNYMKNVQNGVYPTKRDKTSPSSQCFQIEANVCKQTRPNEGSQLRCYVPYLTADDKFFHNTTLSDPQILHLNFQWCFMLQQYTFSLTFHIYNFEWTFNGRINTFLLINYLH